MTRHGALALALVTLAACQSAPSLGTTCTRAADCEAPLTCRAGRCRTECVETRDCPIGSECLPVGSGGAACALAQDRCAGDADCTAPLVCGSDGRCRAACLTDADCTSDGHCVLAGRLVCVASASVSPPAGCTGATNTDFADGLDGWCIETSDEIDASVVRPVAAGFDGHAAEIDLSGAPVGAWVRLYQEVPLDGHEEMVFDRTSAAVEGATTAVVIELLDADGFVLGRIARAVAGDGTSDCAETGRASTRCYVEPFSPNVAMSPVAASGAEYANVDLRSVARVRRVFELARTGQGTADLVIDDVGIYNPPCVAGWWREGAHLGIFDLDDPAAPPAGFSYADAPVQTYGGAAVCGLALALDGRQYVDWSGALPAAYTASFMWHGTQNASSIDGLSLVHELGGDVDVSVVANQIVLTGCGQRVADSARIVPSDARFQELQVSVDRAAGRICLARSGHLVGCADAPACGSTTPSATGLRFMQSARTLGDLVALDEIRVDSGIRTPSGDPSSGQCALDRACHEYASLELRDAGSGECAPPSSCSATWLCPEAAMATDATLCGALATTACVLDDTCPDGVRPCDGSPCTALRLEQCTQPLASACP